MIWIYNNKNSGIVRYWGLIWSIKFLQITVTGVICILLLGNSLTDVKYNFPVLVKKVRPAKVRGFWVWFTDTVDGAIAYVGILVGQECVSFHNLLEATAKVGNNTCITVYHMVNFLTMLFNSDSYVLLKSLDVTASWSGFVKGSFESLVSEFA